ncbi:hypothetical protein J27TS8_11580 [Robertmurraya siralis]|uniref:DinB-like domain-containing protein n=1 Tax=Robertmurraya siralis TaxID=77777 RepID=A0A919WFW9_9BACI|nr:DinB family protein [Robertmurraya siralis]PAE20207.1 hypothetical protein CHH80_12970 [Bacillus sp. 7504-2]GIN61165.1 hypothetical protein J27TS8_11580 [Robertmurraya siralis]
MNHLANIKVVVPSIASTLEFYKDILQFNVLFFDDRQKAAMVEFDSGQNLLLVEDSSLDVTRWLAPSYHLVNSGERLYFRGNSSHIASVKLNEVEVTKIEKEWGDTILEVTDPNGYILSFWEGKELSFLELLEFYELAPIRLKKALEGLNERDLDLVRAPGKWSIRQTVLHMVDSDASSLAMVKFALAEPGRIFNANGYNPDTWVEGLDYQHRTIGAEVALFIAIRKHISGLLRHLPNAMDRTIQISSGPVVTVRERIRLLMSHALGHIEQILETRRIHGK